MAARFATDVEFIGGPIDGHTTLMVVPMESFLGVQTIPNTENNDHRGLLSALLRLLCGSKAEEIVPLAVYKLDKGPQARRRYRYVGTQAVTQAELTSRSPLDAAVERLGSAATWNDRC